MNSSDPARPLRSEEPDRHSPRRHPRPLTHEEDTVNFDEGNSNVTPLPLPATGAQQQPRMRWVNLRGAIPLPTAQALRKIRVPLGGYAIGATGSSTWLYAAHHLSTQQMWFAIAISTLATGWDAVRLHCATKIRIHRETLAHQPATTTPARTLTGHQRTA